MDSHYWFVVGALAVWRLTHALNVEDGPARLFARLRRTLGRSRWGSALGCFYCLSLWVGLPVAALIGSTLAERALLWLALSGAACLLERFSTPAGAPAPAIYWEEKEHEDALLRKQPDQPGSLGEPR
jgi:hypothetical protein